MGGGRDADKGKGDMVPGVSLRVTECRPEEEEAKKVDAKATEGSYFVATLWLLCGYFVATLFQYSAGALV